MWKKISGMLLLALLVSSWGYSQQVSVDSSQLLKLEEILKTLKQEVSSLKAYSQKQEAAYQTLSSNYKEKVKLLIDLEANLTKKELLLEDSKKLLTEVQKQSLALSILLTQAQESLQNLSAAHLRNTILYCTVVGVVGLSVGAILGVVLPRALNF